MPFTTIPSSLIEVGKAITRTLFSTYIKDNLDDLDSRVSSVEASASKIVIFDELVINASGLGSTITGLDVYRVQSSIDMTDVKVGIFEKGSFTGNLEIDIKVSSNTDFSSAVSIFTTKPRIVYSTASSYDESNNAVLNGTTKALTEGDYLRLDVTEMPAGGTLGKFTIYAIGEPS